MNRGINFQTSLFFDSLFPRGKRGGVDYELGNTFLDPSPLLSRIFSPAPFSSSHLSLSNYELWNTILEPLSSSPLSNFFSNPFFLFFYLEEKEERLIMNRGINFSTPLWHLISSPFFHLTSSLSLFPRGKSIGVDYELGNTFQNPSPHLLSRIFS